ncbi:rotatin [Biomphalaria glabrata]|nr:rotatin-like [Biomphalaria glabrata]
MGDQLRKDVDFNGLFRKLGHSLEEIRVRALENIQSKLDHKLICYADIIHEKQLYIRLLEWFNVPDCTHKTEVLSLLNRLSQYSSGAQLIQDIGGIEFLTQLRSDIEPAHRPIIDQILESIMILPETKEEEHATECIYHKPTDSAIWGASRGSDSTGLHMTASMDRLSLHDTPSYFTTSPRQSGQCTGHQVDMVANNCGLICSDIFRNHDSQDLGLFHLSTFPWLPLTQTDQQVIESTKSTLQTKDPTMLIGACEFLADVVFQDFPAELFLQRPEILKNLLSITSLPDPLDCLIVIQACKTLTCYLKCLQVRIHSFQDPSMYTLKQDFNASSSTDTSAMHSTDSSRGAYPQRRNYFDWGNQRHRGDGQDVETTPSDSRSSSVNTEPDDQLDMDDEPSLIQHQLTVPQFCVSVLQRILPKMHTSSKELGVAVIELIQEALNLLMPTLDMGIWTDNRSTSRDVVDRLVDCVDCFTDLLTYHHHRQHTITPKESSLAEVSTHRILYMGLVHTLTSFLTMMPLDMVQLPEKLKLIVPSIVYDEALALANSRYRSVMLAVAQKLGLSVPTDFQHVVDICRSLNKTCQFCMQVDAKNVSVSDLADMAEESISSLSYHLHLPFVSKFVCFISKLCSSKAAERSVVTQCTGVLLQLMSYPIDSVRLVCYVTITDTIKKNLQVSQATDPKSQSCLLTKFLINPDVLYEITCFGLADSVAKVRSCSADSLNHLLQSQLLMTEGLWQEFLLALMKSLPVLQGYTDHTTPLGRSLWYILDPTTTTHNLPLFEKLRGSLRLMCLSDKKLRMDAAKHVKWFLRSETMAENKLPDNFEVDKMSSLLILPSPQLVEDNTSRSVFKEEGLKQVYDIFTSHPVDPGVKKSAGEQMAIMLKDPHLHAAFKSSGGVEVVCFIVQHSVLKKEENVQDNSNSNLPACISILRYLTHYDYALRHTLAKDQPLYYSLIRVGLIHQESESIRADVSHILTLLLFDEVAKFDVSFGQSQTPGTKFSLPVQIVQRYRLPFKPQVHYLTSPNAITLPDPSKDIMTTSGPSEMMKITWNCAWQAGIDQLLDSFKTPFFSETNKEFSDQLILTPVEREVLEISHIPWCLKSNILTIQQATDHSTVMAAVDRMMSYTTALPVPLVIQYFSNQEWFLVFNKFMMVTPTSQSDQSLLLHILSFMNSVLHCLKPSVGSPCPALAWLMDKIYQPEGPMISLLNKPGLPVEPEYKNTIRRLNKELLNYLTSVNLSLPYQLSYRVKPLQLRGEIVRTLQRGFNIGDAPHFYNLASLESSLFCLMHITARPGWSCECGSMDSISLCNQLLNSLLEVVWSFHIGRGGASRSYMGKGVTKSCSLCLRHLAYEMITKSDDPGWVKSWLYTRQDPSNGVDQGLNWLLTLWAYRDPEVRAAGLGIAVALTSTEAGRLLVNSNCKHIPGGLWGAAFSILLDPLECCVVQQQAALLLINLTSQTMPSGNVETTPGTWQGPVVIDPDCQVTLTGINALEALLDHTKFYLAVSDMVTTFCSTSLVHPLLVTTDSFPIMEASNDLTISISSSETSSAEKTARTGLTTVSSLSSDFTLSNLTPRLRTTLEKTKSPAQRNTFSSSTSTQASIEDHVCDSAQGHGTPPSQSLATPGLLSAVVTLLRNVLVLTPESCLDKMRSKGILSSLISLVKPGFVQVLCDEMTNGQPGSASALVLIDLLHMFESIANLLTACVALDTRSRLDILDNKSGLKSLSLLLVLQWLEKDDVAKAFDNVSLSVLNLLSSLLQKREVSTLTTVTQVLGPIWTPLIECLCLILDDRSLDKLSLQLACLDFLTLLCSEESLALVKNPERLLDTASVSELLDTSLEDDSLEHLKETKTTGRQICKTLVRWFESVIKINVEEKGTKEASRKLKVISAFKSLLAISQSAKEFALDAGLVEVALDYLKQTHASLSLETLDMVKVGGRKEGPYLQELVLMFDFLHNLMFNNANVKVTCYHGGLIVVVQKLWAWCHQDTSLLSSILSLLTVYSAHCNSAAGSLSLPMSAQSSTKPSGQLTILHGVLKLAQRELDRDECSPILKLTFSLLTNLVMNAECRNILLKSTFLNQFSQLNPRRKRSKVRVAIDMLWCDLLTALSFSVDGQQIILKIPDVLTVLLDMLEAGSTHCQHCSTLIIRNLCCHSTNKPKLLAVDRLIAVLMDQMDNTSDEKKQLVAISALWAFIYNNHKARVQVKLANVLPRLVDLLHDLQAGGSKSQMTNSKCDLLKTIVSTLRD